MEAVNIPVSAISAVETDRTDARAKVYDLSGRLVAENFVGKPLPKGVYIQNGRKQAIVR
jgi:hypothetical protein